MAPGITQQSGKMEFGKLYDFNGGFIKNINIEIFQKLRATSPF